MGFEETFVCEVLAPSPTPRRKTIAMRGRHDQEQRSTRPMKLCGANGPLRFSEERVESGRSQIGT